MWQRLSLRARMLGVGMGLMAAFAFALGASAHLNNSQIEAAAEAGCEKLTQADLDNQARNLLLACQTVTQTLENQVAISLRVAGDAIGDEGTIVFDEKSPVEWLAVNQLTQERQTVTLPRVSVGEQWLGQIAAPETPAPLVDHVRELLGGTCTVFQRMNERGDMLRICTNVINKEGKRAIGTYIPATDKDGKSTPVLAKVLAGQDYIGRAFVVDGWYSTGYRPLKDHDGKVIGMIYVGVPERDATAHLRSALLSVKVGESGRAWVLNAKGDTKGQYVMTPTGEPGKGSEWNQLDAEGQPYIQNICNAALSLENGKLADLTYALTNGDRQRVHIGYFAPWDWVIGISAPESELNKTVSNIQGIASRSEWIQLSVSGMALLVSAGIWLVTANGINRRISSVATELLQGSDVVLSASAQTAKASESLAQGASEQAASVEETSATLHEMSTVSQDNARTATQTLQVSSQARDAAVRGNDAMSKMNQAIREIETSATETAKIIRVIDEIAFQTNLLALNAAVEAARAGEAGKGFAVVAEEVRNLAMRSAEAARSTSSLIEGSVNRTRSGVEISNQVAAALGAIVASAEQVTQLVQTLDTSSTRQAQSVEQVTRAMQQIDQVTQGTAAGAEQSAASSKELASEAKNIRSAVDDLVVLVNGSKA